MWLRLLLRYDAAFVPELLYAISPRELDHHNNATNWKVQREWELIYALNAARRFPNDRAGQMMLQRQIRPMIWHARRRSLLYCVWHFKVNAALSGLSFALRHWDYATGVGPEKGFTWEDAIRLIGENDQLPRNMINQIG